MGWQLGSLKASLPTDLEQETIFWTCEHVGIGSIIHFSLIYILSHLHIEYGPAHVKNILAIKI